jgi:predicted transposase YdaD
VVNTKNEGIKKAVELISFENLTPEERATSKNKEAAKITKIKNENAIKIATEIETKIEIAKNLKNLGISVGNIANATGLSENEIEVL